MFIYFFTTHVCHSEKGPTTKASWRHSFVILLFLMFCWFFFCSQVYNEEKRWKTKGPTYTALWGHFFATPRCNPQMTGRRGWRTNPGFMFVIFVRFEVFPFLWPLLKLFKKLIWKFFLAYDWTHSNLASSFSVALFMALWWVELVTNLFYLLRRAWGVVLLSPTSLFYFLQMVPSSLPWSSYGFTHITPCPAKWLW